MRACQRGLDGALTSVSDGDAEVVAGEDADGVLLGLACGGELICAQKGESVAWGDVAFDALAGGAAVFDVERVKGVLLGEPVEFRVSRGVEFVPGHKAPRIYRKLIFAQAIERGVRLRIVVGDLPDSP